MRIRWTMPALEYAKSLVSHIRERNSDAASEAAQEILDGLNGLLAFLRMRRPGVVEAPANWWLSLTSSSTASRMTASRH